MKGGILDYKLSPIASQGAYLLGYPISMQGCVDDFEVSLQAHIIIKYCVTPYSIFTSDSQVVSTTS